MSHARGRPLPSSSSNAVSPTRSVSHHRRVRGGVSRHARLVHRQFPPSLAKVWPFPLHLINLARTSRRGHLVAYVRFSLVKDVPYDPRCASGSAPDLPRAACHRERSEREWIARDVLMNFPGQVSCAISLAAGGRAPAAVRRPADDRHAGPDVPLTDEALSNGARP